MTKKTIFLITCVLLLAALSLYLNRDWFRSDPIQIGDRSVPPRGWMARRTARDPSNPVIFLLNRQAELTSVEVVPLAELKTNQFAHPIWQLTSKSNSAPVNEFVYGMTVRGMKPAVQGAAPDPLQPGVKYRILIDSTDGKAQHDFTPVPRSR